MSSGDTKRSVERKDPGSITNDSREHRLVKWAVRQPRWLVPDWLFSIIWNRTRNRASSRTELSLAVQRGDVPLVKRLTRCLVRRGRC